ncbi:MAG: 4Fe-4S dicluster domain-containing protein, partial [Dehalococcoidia bacterium]
MSRQLAVVIDLNKCMGCQTCTVACKVLWTDKKGMDHHWWMKVNTMPGRGYPRDWSTMGGGYDAAGNLAPGRRPTEEEYGGHWEFRPWEVYTSGGRGSGAHLTPGRPTWGPNWDEDVGGGVWPNPYYFYLPRLCNQCSRPACAEGCPSGAIRKREDGGITVVDEGICSRCPDPVCIDACPYKEVFWDPVRQAARKCEFCLLRLEREVAPACVRQCPGRAMWIDYLDHVEGVPHKLVNVWRVALPLHAEWGTGPNVYYV